MTAVPANIFSLPGVCGKLEQGQPADVTLIDPKAEWTVDTSEFTSKGKNNPFHGKKLTGRVIATYVAGLRVYEAKQ